MAILVDIMVIELCLLCSALFCHFSTWKQCPLRLIFTFL